MASRRNARRLEPSPPSGTAPTRTALITGAATGIGLATARALSENGWRVIGTALPGQDVTSLRDLDRTTVLEVDLTDDESLRVLLDAVVAQPRLDAVVSNAGLAVPGPIEGLPADQLRRQLEINTIAPAVLARALLPQLRATGGGMVFVGAGQGRVALPFGGAYGASKAALAALTDALRAEVAGSGVSVSLIEPGAVRTGILTDSTARGHEVLDGMPADVAGHYRAPMLATFQRAEQAFRTAAAPEDIARLIATILDTRTPKPRHLIGREARALALIALLPSSWRARIVQRLAR
ncbi:SDR family NAD(P)-dependent oxidoreductase [Microbacterium sp. zg-YB36]|uniref:SDR family NAD(P)-dependent oxidoreductase n=1 Tax=Microbacterium sp. zg-YB36 TaxID=2969407 RepID=UPI00214B5E04|nr:SDR family NAD(P)-dependent oxidoreductase [Microbacterium sp. zg-YB36]MDL5352722.1 SDR family NAD(P)-dependent oxidoreductase [Microbacterium sp. zg-YB36]